MKTTTIWMLTLSALLFLAGGPGCGEAGDPTESCSGSEVSVEGKNYCVVAQKVVVENGFSCPADMPNLTEMPDYLGNYHGPLAVCGPDADLPPGLLDDIGAQYHMANPSAPSCVDGVRVPSRDGCNVCECESGDWGCTEEDCNLNTGEDNEPWLCMPGDTRPSVDGCNECACGMDGQWTCSARGCAEVCPEPRDTQGMNCDQVITWAKSPNMGLCCEYATPCQAPEGWEQFSDEATCQQ